MLSVTSWQTLAYTVVLGEQQVSGGRENSAHVMTFVVFTGQLYHQNAAISKQHCTAQQLPPRVCSLTDNLRILVYLIELGSSEPYERRGDVRHSSCSLFPTLTPSFSCWLESVLIFDSLQNFFSSCLFFIASRLKWVSYDEHGAMTRAKDFGHKAPNFLDNETAKTTFWKRA